MKRTLALVLICAAFAGCGGFDLEYRKQPPGSLAKKYGIGDIGREPNVPGLPTSPAITP